MVKLVDLKKRQKVRFLKESETIANKYSKLVTHHMVSNFQKFANECFNLVEKYTDDNTRPSEKDKIETNCLRSSLEIQHNKCKCTLCKKLRKTESKPLTNKNKTKAKHLNSSDNNN